MPNLGIMATCGLVGGIALPTSISLSNNTVQENVDTSSNYLVGTFTLDDGASDDIVLQTGSGTFVLTDLELFVKAGINLNYEIKKQKV